MLPDPLQSVTYTETLEPWSLRGDTSPPAVKHKREKPEYHSKAFVQFATEQSFRVQPATREEEIFRHSGWSAKRAKVLATLNATSASAAAIERFEECGSGAYVEWSETEQRYRIACNQCRNRHCEPCQRSRANKLAANLVEALKRPAQGKYRFITLTLRHSDTPLIDQIKRLYGCFKKLRKSKLWSNSQIGGAAILEIKYKPETRRWHPHLHIVAEGGYLAKSDLSAAWLAITRDSSIVDIRILDSGKDAAYYVSKYVTKGTSSSVWQDPNAAAEWVTATKGVRVCLTYGKWRGYKLLKVDKSVTDWRPVVSVTKLISLARQGNARALALLLTLRRDVLGKPPDK